MKKNYCQTAGWKSDESNVFGLPADLLLVVWYGY
jgi:hypothetical protein